MDNSRDRLNDVFFYGLYMDEDILKEKGIEPRNRREAVAKGFRLRIGNGATLLRDEESKAYGMLYSLSHEEIDTLYKNIEPKYVCEAIFVECEEEMIPALCYTLLDEPLSEEKNEEYYHKLITCMDKYTLPKPMKV